MKILMVNKFLYPKGGAETYMLKLGGYLESQGHEVQYFGMDSQERCVGNRAGAYTSHMDFHTGSMLRKAAYPFKIIYSAQARRKLRCVLEDFHPEVVHLNNFNYQLTPSIILEVQRWRTQTGHRCRLIYTAHDYQLVCPNHLLYDPATHKVCEKCLGGRFSHCLKGKCIHGSKARSAVGSMEAFFWKRNGVYRHIDTIICCSEFLKGKLDWNPLLAEKTVTLHNFTEGVRWQEAEKRDYILYFGRFSVEKGIGTLLEVCKSLPEALFVFAGSGPLEGLLDGVPNVKNVGFQSGKTLETLIREARFSVCPSEWYENCPFSVIESLMYGTPVLGADIGGIPELIRDGETGELFRSGDAGELRNKIQQLWEDRSLTERYSAQCRDVDFDTVSQYAAKLMKIYEGRRQSLL